MGKPDSGAAIEEDPAIEDTEKGSEEKPEEKAKADERRADNRDDGPPKDSPRWKEVYGKWKDTERRLEEREKDVEAIREHNRALENRLNQIEAKKQDRPQEPEPDPAVDPDAYKKWHEMKRLQDKEEDAKARAVDRHETQVEMQKELHEDYLEMIKIAERDMSKDPELKKKIWGSGNAPREAYQYGKKEAKKLEDKAKEEESREAAKRQTETEPEGQGGGEPEEKPEAKLSDDEVRVCKNLFPEMKLEDAKKKYIKQKKALGRV